MWSRPHWNIWIQPHWKISLSIYWEKFYYRHCEIFADLAFLRISLLSLSPLLRISLLPMSPFFGSFAAKVTFFRIFCCRSHLGQESLPTGCKDGSIMERVWEREIWERGRWERLWERDMWERKIWKREIWERYIFYKRELHNGESLREEKVKVQGRLHKGESLREICERERYEKERDP